MSKLISSLPLPSSSQILQHNLSPDPIFPTPKVWFEKLKTTSSLQRRARLLQNPAHFSYVSPGPLQFPYPIVAPDPPQEGDDQGAFVERWLTAREPLEPVGNGPSSSGLEKWTSTARTGKRELLGVATVGLRDCVPQLDIGDALDIIGEPSLSDCKINPVADMQTNLAREELVNVLSGHTMLVSIPPNEPDAAGYAPWSVRYSGHQFGNWAGQLGDGRAISILETPHPSGSDVTYELQLKGAGRTPFSRGADGLAVVRSSIREYLCSEAMHALGIPTTRSLALIGLPDLEVRRETIETACVLTRVASSFIRIGNFQAFNPPRDVYVFGGGQQKSDYNALRQLGIWVARRVLKLGELDKPWGLRLVMECARQNALMLAGWQAYGFMHGVMNTDNVSIAGLTIDYGPYAFMDVYDPGHICNHTDEEGRYAFRFQPTMITFALRQLLDALAPLIGAEEATGEAQNEGWASAASEEDIKAWREAGLKHQNNLDLEIQDVFIVEYKKIMRRRLGLASARTDDLSKVIDPLLDLMFRHDLDFHATFRALAVNADDVANIDALDIDSVLVSPMWEVPPKQARDDMRLWLRTYAERRKYDDAGKESMHRANPRFILRQWVLEEVIKRVTDDALSGRRILAKILHMAEQPFEPWGGEGRPEADLSAEEKEERRMCSLGGREMLGFQCSCSS